MRQAGKHAVALALFAGVTVMWLAPVLGQSDMVVPGGGAGDNVSFVWNTWWMRHAVFTGQWPLRTSLFFFPFGVDLTLHTHTALPSALGAVLSRGGSIVAATNVVIALHLFLNFAATYALLVRARQEWVAAIVGALAFGWSPYISAHLPGHFNLIAAWVLPLTALLLVEALDSRRGLSRVLLGLSLAGTAYIDYYYAVYAGMLVVLLVALRSAGATLVRQRPARWQSGALTLLAALFVIAIVVAVTIVVTGGGTIRLGGRTVWMLSASNPISAAGLLAFAALAILIVPRIRLSLDRDLFINDLRRLRLPFAIATVALLPLVLAAVGMWQRGAYVSQRYLWRSAPPGIDVGTFFLGNPRGWAWGALPERAYLSLGIDSHEQVAWFGPGVLALCVCAWLLHRDAQVRRWLAVGAMFLLWALGPYLVGLGYKLPILLPATLVRYVPIVANARIPGRAIVVVYLVASILAAMGVTALLARGRRTLATILCALVLIDYVPSPPPVYRLEVRMVDDVIRRHPDGGAVCELPMGLRDGFGERGRFDASVLFYQTVHERPMTGGFVARLPPVTADAYARDPILGVLLRLSEGGALSAERLPPRSRAGALLAAHGITFVVVNRHLTPSELATYVETGLPLRLIAEDVKHRLYRVVPGEAVR